MAPEIAKGLYERFVRQARNLPLDEESLLALSAVRQLAAASRDTQLEVFRATFTAPADMDSMERGILVFNRLALRAWLLAQKLPLEEGDISELVSCAERLEGWLSHFNPYITAIGDVARSRGLSESLWQRVEGIHPFLVEESDHAEARSALKELEQLFTDLRPEFAVRLRDRRNFAASAQERADGERYRQWGRLLWRGDAAGATPAITDLIRHAETARTGSPGKTWIKQARKLLEAVDHPALSQHLADLFRRVFDSLRDPADERPIDPTSPDNTAILKGLCWIASLLTDAELARGVGTLAFAASKKLPGTGPRSVSLCNAAVYALGQMSDETALGQLAILKIKVKAGNLQKSIEKALTAAAERMQVPREEIEEMGVPAYGLTEVGRLEETFGGFTAELTVDPRGKSELAWRKGSSSGKPQKSIPAAVKSDFPEELKDLKGAIKDLEKMVPAQRDRLDNLFLERKAWPFAVWKERYLDHPVVGILARRLIWRFTCGNGKSVCDGIWHDGRIVNVDDQKVARLDEPGVTVELWHPVGRPMDDVLAWRGWLEQHEVRQPFKQAHRELYLLTDAERRTNTYSNRYAAHILRQHQFHALCGVRGWKNKLRLMVDDIYAPPTKFLPQWGLRAEFWVEGIGDRYGTDTTDSGSFLYLATDQVRFYRIQADQRYAHAYGGGYEIHGEENPANEPLPLDLIPSLAFSEILRDVDLFVGVCSVGNDPTWADGGPEGRYARYWADFSFGDLSVTARTRKEVLERLIPRLKIAPRCSFDEKFLKVRGDLRTYKIHLGSGNILMEPNDQYLCIVPDSRMEKGSDGMFLPFEGDRTLSIILSKAMLLAADTKITDTTITRQIEA